MKTSGEGIGKIRIFSKVLYRLGETVGYYCVIPRERSDRGNPYLQLLKEEERIATTPTESRNDAGESLYSVIPRFDMNLGESLCIDLSFRGSGATVGIRISPFA